jgi:hypothetical protein
MCGLIYSIIAFKKICILNIIDKNKKSYNMLKDSGLILSSIINQKHVKKKEKKE